MRRLASLAMLVIGALGASAPQPEAAYFLGNWSCANVPWTFVALGPGSSWIRDTYGDPMHPDGTAVFGYVESMHSWVYRDFHSDGSYADLTSSGLKDGRWEFIGPYYRASGGPALNGRITYTIVSPTQYDRSFASQQSDGTLKPMGGDSCRKSP